MLDKSYERKIKIISKLDFQTTEIFNYRAKIIGKKFGILCFKCLWVNRQVDALKKLEETMHVHGKHLSQDSTFDLL